MMTEQDYTKEQGQQLAFSPTRATIQVDGSIFQETLCGLQQVQLPKI
jgi:hypothetical protein